MNLVKFLKKIYALDYFILKIVAWSGEYQKYFLSFVTHPMHGKLCNYSKLQYI